MKIRDQYNLIHPASCPAVHF